MPVGAAVEIGKDDSLGDGDALGLGLGVGEDEGVAAGETQADSSNAARMTSRFLILALAATWLPAGEVLPEPLDRRDPRPLRCVGCVAGAGVVVEGMVDAWEDRDLVRHTSFFQLLFHLRRARRDSGVLLRVDRERRRLCLGADVLIVGGLRAVVRHRGFEVRARREQVPDLASAEAETDGADRTGADRLEVAQGGAVIVELLLERQIADSP